MKKFKDVTYLCHNCLKSFPVDGDVAKELKKSNKKAVCPICGKDEHTTKYGTPISDEVDAVEHLTLICHKCGKKWNETRPKGYVVRYNRRGNFLVNRKHPEDKKFFKCPKCRNTKNIGRLAVEKVRMKMHASRTGGPT